MTEPLNPPPAPADGACGDSLLLARVTYRARRPRERTVYPSAWDVFLPVEAYDAGEPLDEFGRQLRSVGWSELMDELGSRAISFAVTYHQAADGADGDTDPARFAADVAGRARMTRALDLLIAIAIQLRDRTREGKP